MSTFIVSLDCAPWFIPATGLVNSHIDSLSLSTSPPEMEEIEGRHAVISGTSSRSWIEKQERKEFYRGRGGVTNSRLFRPSSP